MDSPDTTTIKLKKNTRKWLKEMKKENKYDTYDNLLNAIRDQTKSVKRLRNGDI